MKCFKKNKKHKLKNWKSLEFKKISDSQNQKTEGLSLDWLEDYPN